MKLLKCYIENFGKLHQFEYEFVEGINTLNKLNGWGKTTFAAFIKAMFYGLNYTTKRAVSENERKKYYPWQGGNFGGNIEFDVNGIKYRIERFFGTKDKEDTFILYNLNTHLKSMDFSSNAGEEIFNINMEAFERSIYIPQKDLNISINDSLNAKLSNLIENTNDINNYETAIAILENKLKFYKKIGDKGYISELKSKLNKTERLLDDCYKSEEAIIDWEDKLKQKEAIKFSLESNLEKIKNDIKTASEYEVKAILKKNYNDLHSNVEKIYAKINEKKELLGENIPTDEELNKYTLLAPDDNIRKFINNNIDMNDKARFWTLERIFINGIPEEKSIDECQKYINQYKNIIISIENLSLTDNQINEYKHLVQLFNQDIPSGEIIESNLSKYNELNELNKKISVDQSKVTLLENIENSYNKRKPAMIGMVITALLAVIAGLYFIYTIPVIGILCWILGGVLFIMLFIRKILSNKNIYQLNEYKKAKESLKGLLYEKGNIENDINDFISKFSLNKDKNDFLKSLYDIKTKYNEFSNLTMLIRKNESKITDLKMEQNNISDKINNFLYNFYDLFNDYNYESVLSKVKAKRNEYIELYRNILNEIKEKVWELNRLKDDFDSQKNILNNFENSNDVRELMELEPSDISLFELQEKEKSLQADLNDLNDEISIIKINISELSKTVDNLNDLENEKESLQDDLIQNIKKYNLLEKTIHYLKTAKEKFSTHYLEDMNSGFDYYVNMINKKLLVRANLDVKLNAKIEEYGTKRELDYYSQGYKDIIGICTRLALIDALFKKEAPFIILDDPFANLDEGKLNNALSLIEKIAKKYQILYLVCHSSRDI